MVEGAYQGEPYFRVEGMFRGSTGEATIHSPHLGIIWPAPDGNHEIARLDTLLPPILSDPLSRSFAFEVWDLPPASSLIRICGTRMALGTLAVYDDVNRDGQIALEFEGDSLRVGAPDKALGMGAYYSLVYVEGVSLEGCEVDGIPKLNPGFHVLAFHDCETWQSLGAFVEVRLFPPAESFPPLSPEGPEGSACSPEM